MKRDKGLSLCLAVIASLTIMYSGCGSDSSPAPDGDSSLDGDLIVDGDEDTRVDGDTEEEKLQPYDYCQADLPPDSECWKQKRDPQSDNIKLATAIADKQLETKIPSELKWDWGESVMLVGLMELYNVTGESRYLSFIQAWMDHNIEKGYAIGSSDTCAPAALAVFLYEKTGEQKYRDVVDAAFYYLNEESLRTEYGGLNHLGVLDLLGVSLWVDSLFMFGNVMTRWGELENDSGVLDFYGEQFDIFTDHLQSESGFYTHATPECKFEQESGIFWGRGNGWVLAAGYDHLRVRRNRGEEDATMMAALEKLTQAAIETQDQESGLWWTVLNRQGETYLETSAAALFAFGMARGYRYGHLDDTVLPTVEKAIIGLKAQITFDDMQRPVLTGVSGPTNPGTTEGYGAIRQVDDVSYGTGAAIMALVETSGLFPSKE
jgi:unsaturated rhamnogalacturonyl hydrolase